MDLPVGFSIVDHCTMAHPSNILKYLDSRASHLIVARRASLMERTCTDELCYQLAQCFTLSDPLTTSEEPVTSGIIRRPMSRNTTDRPQVRATNFGDVHQHP